MTLSKSVYVAFPAKQLRLFLLSSRRKHTSFTPARANAAFTREYSQKPLQQIDLTPRPSTSQKKWNQLSAPQKVVRTATTGGNLLIILAGMAMTGVVVTLFYSEVLAPDSKTNWFNRAVARIKDDESCLQLLGQKSSIKAYGEPTADKWTRNRPIASTVKIDRHGVEHFLMHFNVEGEIDRGVVQLHLVKRPGQDDYDYKYLFLDVKGQRRVYLENADDKPDTPRREKKGLFGIRWG